MDVNLIVGLVLVVLGAIAAANPWAAIAKAAVQLVRATVTSPLANALAVIGAVAIAVGIWLLWSKPL
jgi:hypothetical protein